MTVTHTCITKHNPPRCCHKTSFQHHNCYMQLSLIIACRAAEGQYTEYEEKPDTWNVTDQALALSCEIGARRGSIVKDVAYVLKCWQPLTFAALMLSSSAVSQDNSHRSESG